MARKRITRRVPPLPKRFFRAADNKAELLLALLRDIGLSSQGPEPQPFYPLRDVARNFRLPLSLAAKVYRELEGEGILRPIRGSGTMLEGLNGTRKAKVKGIVAIATSVSRFVTHRDYRAFVITIGRELRRHELAAFQTFYDSSDSAEGFVDRLRVCHPDKVIWYRPPELCREVAPRLHDLGIPIIAVADGGLVGVPCRYEIRRESALIKIVSEWKNDSITLVKVVTGPVRSTGTEARIGYILEESGVTIKFVRLGTQPLGRFVESLIRGRNLGIVMLNSTASRLATGAPEALFRFSRDCRLALFDGPVSIPFSNLADGKVDFITVEWQTVAKRIVDDLVTPRFHVSAQSFGFEAEALRRVPWDRCSNMI